MPRVAIWPLSALFVNFSLKCVVPVITHNSSLDDTHCTHLDISLKTLQYKSFSSYWFRYSLGDIPITDLNFFEK